MKNKHLFKSCISSPLPGSVVVIWSEGRNGPFVIHILLPGNDEPAESRASRIFTEAFESSCMEIGSLCSDIEAYLSGEKICFSLDLLDLESCTTFQQSVLKAQHMVPYGHVTTYGKIATEIGRPGAAQAVGNALAANPFPIVIPCHRTVQADGSIGGFQGGSELKRKLLTIEGVISDSAGKITC